MPLRFKVRDVATEMIGLVSDAVLGGLQEGDPASTIETHYRPVRVRLLPPTGIPAQQCSLDGEYNDYLDPEQPLILYSNAGGPQRARFTIVHELGHHILATDGAFLLDDLDLIGEKYGGAGRAEEAACHQFAGRVLVPAELLGQIVGEGSLEPQHILRLHEESNASWEAVAIRAAEYARGDTAVILIRDEGYVSFVTASWPTFWARNSSVEPGGPLDRALRHDSRGESEAFRYGLGGADAMFCDTVRVDGRLAVAVMSRVRNSKRGLSFLKEVEPKWKEEVKFCLRCNVERDEDWCDNCKGPRCPDCKGCGCQAPVENRSAQDATSEIRGTPVPGSASTAKPTA